MTTENVAVQVGVDVCKASLSVSLPSDEYLIINNTLASIKKWLSGFSGHIELAMEATGTYHLELAQEAHRRGHTVYLINGYRLNRYRDSVGVRAKTDHNDARLLRRYLERERDQLMPWEPAPPEQMRLQALLKRRACIVTAKVKLDQSLADIPELKSTRTKLSRALKDAEKQIMQKLNSLIKDAGWDQDMRRCQSIEGIGPVTSVALTSIFHRGKFRNSDAFVAYLGLDVRVRDSGKTSGKRKLTKQGDSEARRLLYLAAMHAKRKEPWHDYYQRYIDRGFAPVQVLTILARKLARVAFALMQNQSDYVPKKACLST